MSHLCHAHACSTHVEPKMLMCRAHWRSLPDAVKAAIWREYQTGQERTKSPTLRYLAVARWAIAEDAERRGLPLEVIVRFRDQARTYAMRSIAGGFGDPLAGLDVIFKPTEA